MLLLMISIFLEYLMSPASDDKYEDGAYDYRYCDRKQFSLDHIEIEHEGNSWRNEEETEVGNEEISHLLDPLNLDELHLETSCEQ